MPTEKSGVRRYRVLRPSDDPCFVMIDLEFSSAEEAEAVLAQLRNLWRRVEGAIIESPRARIVEVVDSREY